ncbi:uncharacterized protein LOC122046956 [Zingiber officinale]|uniref:Uncharacterized protein n=1 Tax=Zingiber officinale TaxID=94328 RepID=A0A8J5HUP5_ZINOF|nr:uncharacterized protein LOC122046956 [Zingiber officinale]KAG6525604.1 hypothetical protein ZIOFF_015566 [Zingiber officinale]
MTTPFVLWRGMPTAPRATMRMPTTASHDYEDAHGRLAQRPQGCLSRSRGRPQLPHTGMKKNAVAGKPPSSLPMTTPPPTTISSLKFGLLSSIHTKSVNAKVDSIYLSAYIDDGAVKTTASH